LTNAYRHLLFRLGFHQRHLREWPILAENGWPHDGRKLTHAKFALRAIKPGQVMLSAKASFEFHAGCPGPAFWVGSGTASLSITVTEPRVPAPGP
jgi:hypothetical protein